MATMVDRVIAENTGNPNCWEWPGARSDGYGVFNVEPNGRKTTVSAHRAVYEAVRGSAQGFECHHVCRNRGCVNPDHIELMPARSHRRFHQVNPICKRGHDKRIVGVSAKHDCRECARIRAREWRVVNRAALRPLGAA